MKLTITPGLAFTIASNSASSIALGSPEKIGEPSAYLSGAAHPIVIDASSALRNLIAVGTSGTFGACGSTSAAPPSSLRCQLARVSGQRGMKVIVRKRDIWEGRDAEATEEVHEVGVGKAADDAGALSVEARLDALSAGQSSLADELRQIKELLKGGLGARAPST